MKRKRKIKWNFGDVFAIPLLNGKYGIGQALDLMMMNVVRCAFYNEVIDSLKNINIDELCRQKDIISLLTVTREQLDYDVWKIIGNKKIPIPKEKFPYEGLRNEGWVGAVTHDAALAEDFLNAYHALAPWDQFYDADYLDGYLIDPSKKPQNLIYVKK